mmetsp:Transcript_43654/g.95193  ORF Transcript_43654/g.95193 Transcript_43654/m.95193 type:complete len:432 (-) Transcript_43654:124-1419(-)
MAQFMFPVSERASGSVPVTETTPITQEPEPLLERARSGRSLHSLRSGLSDSDQSDQDHHHGLQSDDSDSDPDDDEEIMELENLPMPEDMYGFAITSLIRDSRMIASAKGSSCLRQSRLLTSQIFILACIFTQAFLLMQTKLLVTSMHVHEIRDLYDTFESTMYGEEGTGSFMESHMTKTVNGKHRGIAQYFHPENFDKLGQEEKASICTISLSRPYFFMIILTIWSLTCLGEAKACCDQAWSIFCTPAVSNMKYSLLGLPTYAGPAALKLKDRLPQALQERVENLSPNERLVVGMTKVVKTYVLACIMLPRLLITLFLLWLGCRWLLATSGFENVLLNAVALEFVLVLKDLLYNTVLPERNKREVQNTSMLPFGGDVKEKASCSKYFGSFALFGLAVIWVYLYTFYLQQVIPGYNWDVRGVCRKYVEKMTA